MRLTKHETNGLMIKLEQRKYGRQFNSMELAQKANVSLDDINRVERQLPIDDPNIVAKIAKTLGVTPELLQKIAGLQDMTEQELYQLQNCLSQPPGAGQESECEALGLEEVAIH